MIQNKITSQDWINLYDKFLAFDQGLLENKPVLGLLESDPTLFAYHFFKDRDGNKWECYPHQDKILNDKSDRVALCCSRQIGKSTTAAIDAIHYAFLHKNAEVIIISHTKPQALEVIRKIKNFLNTSRFTVWKTIMPKGKESKAVIEIRNEKIKGKPDTYSRIISVPATDAARGYSPDRVICDEQAFWENAEYIFNQVVEPMTTHTKGKIMVLSTPNGKKGIFWRTMNNKYYSKYQFDWTVCPAITEEEIKRKRAGMTRMQFEAEYEAKFNASKNAYFGAEEIQKAVEKLTLGRPHDGVCFGIDFGKINDNAVIIGCKIRNPEDEPKDHVVEVVERIVKPLGTSYADIVGEVKRLSERYPGSRFYLDATGVGEGPCDMLREESVYVEPIKFSWQRKADMMGKLKILFEQDRIKIPDERELIDQLELFEYEYTSSGVIKLHAAEGSHDDEVDALALAAYGFTQSPPVSMTII